MKRQKRGDERRKPATEFEMLERKAACARMMTTGAPKTFIRDHLQKQLGLSPAQARNVLKAVEDDLVAEYEGVKNTARAEQLYRVQCLLSRAHAEAQSRDASVGEKIEWNRQIIALEGIVSKILGTTVPHRVEVTVRPLANSIADYMAGLSSEELEELYREGAGDHPPAGSNGTSHPKGLIVTSRH